MQLLVWCSSVQVALSCTVYLHLHTVKLALADSLQLQVPITIPVCLLPYSVVCFLQDYFYDRIAQLTFTFPEDAITSTGAPFWSAPKRFPHVVKFDAADPAHASFVQVRGCERHALRNLCAVDTTVCSICRCACC